MPNRAQGPTHPAPEAIALSTIEIEHPNGLAFSPSGTLLVAAGTEGILEFDPAQPASRRVLVPGAADRSFSAIAVTQEGTILAIEEFSQSLLRFNPHGEPRPLPPSWERAMVDERPMRLPAGIAVTPDGSRIAIADAGNDRITLLDGVTEFDATPAPPRAIGTESCGDWMLRAPSGVAFDRAGRLFVTDSDNHRIVRFGRDGKFEAAFGTRGSNPGQFERPLAVISDDGSLLIVDHYNHRVQRLDEDGDFRTQWGMHAVVPREGNGKIHYPVAIASDPARALFAVAEPFERRVQIFRRSREGERVPLAPPPPSREGVSSHFGEGIAVDGTLLAVWEPEASAIVVFDLRGERPVHVTTFGSPGRRINEIGRVIAIAADEASERIWIVDAGNRRIVEWSLQRDPSQELRFEPFMGRVTRAIDFDAIGSALSAAGAPATRFDPIAIAYAPGELLVLDRSRGRVVRLDDATLMPRGMLLDADMGFPRDPIALAVDSERRRIAILDGRDPVRLASITALGPESTTRVVPRPPTLKDPRSIAWGGSGGLVVTDGDDQIALLSTDGAILPSAAQRGMKDGEVWHPRGVASAADGSFFIVDWGNHRLQRFDSMGEWLARFGIGRSSLRPRMPDAVPPVLRPRPGSTAPAAAPPAMPAGPWPREVSSNDGTRVRWRPVDQNGTPLAAIPLRDPFFVRLEGSAEALGALALRIDASMPHHGHGMNLVPTEQSRDGGGFLVGPLLFHMPGAWEIYFDLSKDGLTRRLQDAVIMDEGT